MKSKELLRKKYNFSEQIDENIALRILSQVQDYIEAKNPSIVGIYLPMKGEIELTSLMVKYPHIKFAAPKIENDNIFFVRYSLVSPIERNKEYTRYLQPCSNEEISPDLIFIPAITFDVRGYRLGRGKGHYDKYLSNSNATKIGLIENRKILEFIPDEEHDQRMDFIISEEVIIDLCK